MQRPDLESFQGNCKNVWCSVNSKALPSHDVCIATATTTHPDWSKVAMSIINEIVAFFMLYNLVSTITSLNYMERHGHQ